MVVACRMARCRIACRMVRRPITCCHVPARVGDLMSLPHSPLGDPNARRLPCPGPTWRCSRRRQRRLTNIYSFTWLYRFMVARSAARLSAIVGPLASRKAVAGQFRQRDIIGHIRASSGHIRAYPGISGHIRARDGRRMRYCPSPGMASGMIVAYRIAGRRARRERWSSRALWPVTGHGVSDGRRVPYRPSPDRVPYAPSPDRVSSHPCACRRPVCPCHVPGRASRTPVVCHVPAQQRL